MAKYSQNKSCGHTCPWGAADDNLPPDEFTLAALKAGRRKGPATATATAVSAVPKDSVSTSVAIPKIPEIQMDRVDRVDSVRSKASHEDLEAKMMDLLEKCLDKKVIQLRGLKKPEKMLKARDVRDVPDDVRSSCSQTTTRSAVPSFRQKPSASKTKKDKTDKKERNEPGKEGIKEGIKEGKSGKDSELEVSGYEALDRYPALLREVNGLADKAITQGLTSTGKQKQAMKLSDASLGKFDADQSRIAYLQMQKSAAEARNKNRSALTFGDDEGPFEAKGEKRTTSKEVTMAGKRAQAQKLSDASLGKFDVDQSQVAFLETHNSAAQMRDKHRVGQGIF